jgi:hypothetical protein
LHQYIRKLEIPEGVIMAKKPMKGSHFLEFGAAIGS